MRKMKDSGIEWIGKIPEGWEVKRLRYLCDIVTGTKDTIDNNPEGKYPFYVRSPIVERIDSYSFYGEAILTAGDGVGAGKVFHYVNGKFNFHQRVYNLHNFEGVNGKFLYYYLKENFYKEIESGSAKNTVDSIRLPMLQNYVVPCPNDLNEQYRIADYLDKKCEEIDLVIKAKETTNEKLKEYRQSIIYEAVTKGLDKNVPMKDSGIEWIGEIPEGWEVKKLKYIGESIIGITYSPDDICDEGLLVLRSSNVQNGKISYEDNVYVSKEVTEKMLVKLNDILICSRNGSKELIGKCALIDKESENSTFGAFMTVFRSEANRYIYYIFNSPIFNYHIGTFLTTTVNQLTIGNLNNFVIPIPKSETEQQQIADFLDQKCLQIDSVISANEKTIEKLKEYRQSVIYEAVTGKMGI